MTLVVIDAQRAFAEPRSPWCTPGVNAALARIRQLAAVSAHVLFTRFVPPDAPVGSWLDYYERWAFARDADPALWDLVAPWTDSEAVDCPTLSKWGPALAAQPELVLCGVSTDCCVLATALAAIDAGARVRVVADACAADPALHEAAIRIMRRRAPQLTLSSVQAELAVATG